MLRTQQSISGDYWSSKTKLVGVIGLDEHNDSSSDIRRRSKALSLCRVEAKAVLQDDRQEIRDRVSAGCGQHVKCSESPNFAVQTVAEIRLDGEGLCDGVGTIVFDASDDESRLGLIQEAPRSR